jgi:predicted nucleic acid-binding protein
MSENPGDKVPIQEVYGVGINKGNINTSKFAKTMTIYESQQQNLAEAARDIQELLEQLEKTYPSETTMDRMKIATEVITHIDNHPTKAQKIFNAIKAGGVAAVEQLLNHPASSFVIAALNDWQKSKS